MQSVGLLKHDSLEILPVDKLDPTDEEKGIIETYFSNSNTSNETKPTIIADLRVILIATGAFSIMQLKEVNNFIEDKLKGRSLWIIFAVKLCMFVSLYLILKSMLRVLIAL
jgi:hypothetical protein